LILSPWPWTAQKIPAIFISPLVSRALYYSNWFQELSLINVCFLISISVCLLINFSTQELGKMLSNWPMWPILCEVDTIIVSDLQRRKQKHKEILYLSLLANSLLIPWIICQRPPKLPVSELRIKLPAYGSIALTLGNSLH
jgi:hypothetical protein